jgi:hypothetical protein
MPEIPPRPSLILGQKLMAEQLRREAAQKRAALATSLSDDGLTALMKALRTFREDATLGRKPRKLLEDILAEDRLRQRERGNRKNVLKPLVTPEEGSSPE